VVAVSDPVGHLAARGAAPVVHGAGLEFATARHRAARRGLELYASAMLDRRLLLAADGKTPAPIGDGWLWGWALDGSGPRLVPASAVFPSDGSLVGVASGPTWASALELALLAHCQEAALAEALAAPTPLPAIPLDLVPLDEVGQRLVRVLRAARAPLAAHDLTGTLGVPTCTLCLGERAVAHASGATLAEALREALEQALLAWQADLTGQPEYRPAPVADLPPALRGRPREPPAGARASSLATALRARGSLPVAVPLDHDPALAAVLPYALRVVLVAP
jgi:hypothetical protein